MTLIRGLLLILIGVAILTGTACETCELFGECPVGGGEGDHVLAVPFQAQQTPVWCWAATTSMVLGYYGVPVQQCTIVANTLALPCCTMPLTSCVTAGPIEAMMGALQYHGGLGPYRAGRALSFDELRSEIDAGRPMIAAYQGSFAGHVVVIHGYDDRGNIRILDPLYGAFTVPYGQTFVYSGSLYWFDTILVNR